MTTLLRDIMHRGQQGTGKAESAVQAHQQKATLPSHGSFNDFSMGATQDADEGYYDDFAEQRRRSAELERKTTEAQQVVDGTRAFKPGTSPHRNEDPWRSVFNPGRNFNMPKNSSIYDTVTPGAPTTWEYIVKSQEQQGRRMSFSEYDTNKDGYLDANELRKHFGDKAQAMISEADMNNDGRIDRSEFTRVMQRLDTNNEVKADHRVVETLSDPSI